MGVDGFSEPELMQALYWIWDAFDRSGMGMFLVYETASHVMNNEHMEGNSITVGVRKNEWISGSTPILKSFTEDPLEETTTKIVFKNPFNKVPVIVYVYDEDVSITSPQQIFYANEYFMIPNTYSRFEKIFGVMP